MARPRKYSPEVRERAVRMVREHGPSIRHNGRRSPRSPVSLAARPRRCATGSARAERDSGHRGGLTTDERQRLKQLERDNRELTRANEILRKAAAFFAQAELDRRPKT